MSCSALGTTLRRLQTLELPRPGELATESHAWKRSSDRGSRQPAATRPTPIEIRVRSNRNVAGQSGCRVAAAIVFICQATGHLPTPNCAARRCRCGFRASSVSTGH